ncbi:GHKL domain-containing protein [Desulfovibrio oxamicus]|uniref:GHKL domain-containing protein n=1 Tax=Nitratidesulfovibrio oxamicus TaxID=32016 RepID=A0ABS0J5W0_9BACT|nr:PAS domain-containing sensor histidine kinase [Nitratidesulfovibrio oxamicus]MBG3877789.1 GHKL domain-containing protein [Nitratidesulfovibrio oxamicus]
MTPPLPTFHAPAERSADADLLRQAGLFRDPTLVSLLDSVTDIVLILNRHRQIVFVNRNLLELLSLSDGANLMGLRPGELFHCENACEGPGGCGTADGCRECGAVKAVLCALGDERRVDECRITQRKGDDVLAYDLKVCATPFDRDGERFVIFAINDISHEKRRRALERIFFHDILNTAGGLRNLAQMILEEVPLDLRGDTMLLHRFSNALVEEIVTQKLLLAAETDELPVDPHPVDGVELLRDVANLYAGHETARGRVLTVLSCVADTAMVTDPTLLGRVLGNLVKNALEATPEQGEVVLGCDCGGDGECVTFRVRNPGYIRPDVQRQIFQRSFSTKGAGRGLGTYSIRLLTQNYLKGRVGFETSPSGWTEFRVCLPRNAFNGAEPDAPVGLGGMADDTPGRATAWAREQGQAPGEESPWNDKGCTRDGDATAWGSDDTAAARSDR